MGNMKLLSLQNLKMLIRILPWKTAKGVEVSYENAHRIFPQLQVFQKPREIYNREYGN